MINGKESNWKESNKSESKNNNEYKEDSNLLRTYIHDIRNSKTFSIDILKNINNLSYKDRLEILTVYNEINAYYLSLFEDK